MRHLTRLQHLNTAAAQWQGNRSSATASLPRLPLALLWNKVSWPTSRHRSSWPASLERPTCLEACDVAGDQLTAYVNIVIKNLYSETSRKMSRLISSIYVTNVLHPERQEAWCKLKLQDTHTHATSHTFKTPQHVPPSGNAIVLLWLPRYLVYRWHVWEMK